MNRKYVILLIVEGKESYTEVNFFNNFFNHFLSKNTLITVGFSKASKKNVHTYNTQKLKREVLSKIENLDKSSDVFVFSFSDLEKRVEKSKTAMINTAKRLKGEITNSNFNANISIFEHIFFKGYSFEDVLNFTFVNKRKTYMKGFNDFCNKKDLFNNEGIVDKDKVEEYFKKTPLAPVINKIIEIM